GATVGPESFGESDRRARERRRDGPVRRSRDGPGDGTRRCAPTGLRNTAAWGFESSSIVARLAMALGVGLLIGLERVRGKAPGPACAAAGVRTVALPALAGALALEIGGEVVLVAVAVFVALLTALAYRRTANADPGLTTEMALLATLLLGAFAMREPAVAAGAGIVVALPLASRAPPPPLLPGALPGPEGPDPPPFPAAPPLLLPS